MLEGLAAWILNTYVGEYFENLNTDQLSVGLLQGAVELENIPLKKDALNHLGYPVEVRSGHIGKVKLQIPVYRLRSEPWVIFIEKLFIVIGPVQSFSYNEHEEETAALKRKLTRLEAKDIERKTAQNGKQQSTSYMYTNWKSYSTSVFASVAENLQLNIRDVHIRYEDDVCIPHRPFACGIIIRGLAAQSTDEKWAPQFIEQSTSEMMWKLIQLDGLSIYWDTNAVMIGSLETELMKASMIKHMETCVLPDSSTKDHEYVLASVDATARFKRNCSQQALRSHSTPRIVCDIQFEKIPLFLRKSQYRLILEWEKGFNSLHTKWSNRRWRPTMPVISSAKTWWDYAVSVHLEPLRLRKRMRTWSFVLQRAKDLTEYTKVYHEYLKNPESLSSEISTVKGDLETKLGYNELCFLRDLVIDRIQKEKIASGLGEKEPVGQGFLQWLFPRWVGWYASPPANSITEETCPESEVTESMEMKSKLEEEILGVLDTAADDSLLKRDAIFAQMNFCLVQGTFVLLDDVDYVHQDSKNGRYGKPLVELEFADVLTRFETRPRSSSALFEIKLGALYIHDRIFNNSCFSHLIAPQSRDTYYVSSGSMLFQFPSSIIEETEKKNRDRRLFELLYEKNPFNRRYDHKLTVKTKSLDVIFNSELICVITNFFKLPPSSSDKSLLSAASAQYEILKQQTKAELQQTWDKIIVGERKHKKRWFIELDISAPQIIIPDNIFDANTSVVVFDLGELHILNSAKAGISDSTSNSCEFDDEDDFHTPCSTPKELLSQSESSNTLQSLESDQIDETHFLYECYTLELKNMQVLVSSLKDSWKFAQLRGSSSLHILNRFSVNIQAHRRTVMVEDSQYPSLAFVASLPKLTLHISEHKISALKSCIKNINAQFNGPSENSTYGTQIVKSPSLPKFECSHSKSSVTSAEDDTGRSVFLLLQFCVDQMTFDIESRSQSVAELQVSGLKTSLSKCGNETSLMLCVHSLLVVDALQTYGPDFELLVASHKRVSMDNSSGKLQNTDPSDTSDFFSPPSPNVVPSSPRAESPLQWSTFEKQLREQSFGDALIFFEFKILEPSDDSEELLQIASVHFNNLDVIANQETIIEIVGLFRRITQDSDHKVSISTSNTRSGSVSEFEFPSVKSSKKIDITFNFQRLNILLLRAMSESCAGQKLATATLSGTQIKAEIGSCIKICGTLGGLQVLDLVTEGTKFPKIISLGNIPTQHSYALFSDQEETTEILDSQEAFSFIIVKRDCLKELEHIYHHKHGENVPAKQEEACELDITVRMASLCYSHSPRLLYELTCCASEFKSYLRSVAHSIRTAAAEVAKGIVSKRYDSPNLSCVDDSKLKNQSEALSSNIGLQSHYLQKEHVPLTFRIDVFLKSPVVILPCSSTRPEVFFAHLGHIAVYNKLCHHFPMNHPFLYSIEEIKDDSLFLEVNGMNMFFVNIDTEFNTESSENNFDFSTFKASNDNAILHDTTLEIFIIPMKELVPTFYQPNLNSGISNFQASRGTSDIMQNQFTIKGDVTPLKVVFTKHQYRQMLELMDNLSYSSPEASSCISPSTDVAECSALSYSDVSSSVSAVCSPDAPIQFPKNRSFLVFAKFELPSFTVELRDDLNVKESLVSLTFQEFTLTYENKNSFETLIQATLSALLMEDLRDVAGSNQPCILMSSKQNTTTQGSVLTNSSRFISTSCPNISELYPNLQWGFSASLPNYLCTENMFQLQNDYRMKAARKTHYKQQSTKNLNASCPNTPPPSPSASGVPSPEPGNTLVNMKALIVDEQSPYFMTKHKKTNLSVNIDLNCLDVILNLHSWILVFEFFDSVSSSSNKENINQNLQRRRTFSNEGCSCPGNVHSNSMYNSELEIKVRSLVVTLSKPEYDLASANVTHFYSQISKRDNSFSLKGKFGGISVSDLTPFGHMYPERFVTTGPEAMHFNIFRHAKYSSPRHHSASDIHVEVQMSSVMYVHTQRFVTDIITFLQYFHQKQCFVSGTQFEPSDCPVHGSPLYASRIRLNILADMPILVIPQNSSSTEVFVVSLGMLTVNNKIVGGGLLDVTECPHPADHGLCVIPSLSLDQSNRTHKAPILTLQAGMIFQKVNRALSIDEFCMLDIINIEIKDADVFSAVHTNFLKRERKRSSASKGYIQGRKLVFPSYVLKKQVPLLKEKVTFKIQVERNIDVSISHKVPDFKICGMLSSVHVTLDLEQYKVFRGILEQNLGEALEEYVYDPCKEVGQFVLMDTNFEVWTTLAFHIDLVNVTLELHNRVSTEGVERNVPLAKFDFINSRFSYEALSDNTKDIDFVSNEIRITDIRDQENISPNVFHTILAPTKQGSSGDSVLQAELHYRLMHDLTKMTILLNNMRVMGILDFLQSTLQFLTCPLPDDEFCSKSFSDIEPLQEPSMATDQKLALVMKINVSNTEFVLAEETSQLDSSAVIVKSTAVIFWKPDNVEKPLSCSLQSLEMFSCILGIEDDTALSIIDPVNLVIELLNKPSSPIARLESNEEVSYSLEVSAANLYIRLSYNDLLLFLKILESVKKQTGITILGNSSPVVNKTSENAIQRLAALGFTTNDCSKALANCDDNLNDAALWLTYNAFPAMDTVSDASPTDLSDGNESGWKSLKLNSIELRIDSVGLCIIDDCRNADVPVLEICLSDFAIFQKINGSYDGHGLFTFSTDYYNCSVSGWEPLMEPWRCKTKWSLCQALSKPSKKYIFHISSDDSVNINITSSFLNLYKTVKKNWTEDYLSGNFKNSASHRRSQFVPFALKNNTGCKLWFATQVIESEKFYVSHELGETKKRTKETSLLWKEVACDEISEVRFESRMKLRHKDSHQMKLHQIVVRIEGWETITPVSVDRVGIYFRCARPQTSPFTTVRSSSFQGRVIFAVVLESSARKLVTVQSALSVINKLDDTLEMKLEYPVIYHGAKEQHLFIVPNEEFPIPLPFVHAQIWVRPINQPVTFSDQPIFWQHITQPGEMEASIKTCKSTFKPSNNYWFCACIKRGKYPEFKYEIDTSKAKRLKSSSTSNHPLPGHRLFFVPCLEITNLLPYEINFSIEDLGISGCIKPGEKKSLHNIDIIKKFSFGISFDNFKRCKKISISAVSRHYPSRLELYDNQDRVIFLQLKILSLCGGAMKIHVSSPYWLINKTGLPLVFKQEGTQNESAGQFEEHEMARNMAPLLFSFSDTEASNMCSMRIGKSLHHRGIPIWCTRFHLEQGVRVRRLHVGRNDSRPDWVYIIGIEVSVGKGKYKDTNIVTLSPRYYLDNRSRHSLEFCQKFALKETSQYVLSAVPNCSLPYHWPRIDLDNMLCVRIADSPYCKWSGGFAIDGNKSFHINMRNGDGMSQFLQTEITLHGATYYVIISDADNLPPPIRIDNHSEVSVTYYQTNVIEERLKTAVRSHSSVPYAWDEPMLPPYITCSAPGGSVATYNMNVFREGNQLFYENFIYIAFSGTFLRSEPKVYPSRKSDAFPEGLLGITDQELVLDVPQGTAVVLSRKAAGKRSQLWRMTSSGMLQHEGSTPPVDLHKPQPSSISAQKLVLDIAGLGAQPEAQIPLMLRKPDARRQHTQTWKFTTDGRLCCSHPNMYVQAKDGYGGLKAGNDAVLGPMMPCTLITMENGIPVEQAVCRQKLRGGSGVLSLKVVPDGPTRVLQITDLKQKVKITQTSEVDDFVVVPLTSSNTECFNLENSNKKKSLFDIQFILKLPNGFGLSIINYLNEELIYVTLQDINIEFSKSASAILIDGSFRDIQIDNQICEAEKPVILFVTPANKTDNQRHLPAMHFTLHRIETSLVNADIFKHLIITVKNLTAHLEERLLMKLLQFFGFDQRSDEIENFNENNNEIQSSLFHHVKNDRRYYFSTLKLSLQQLRLSVHTTDHLPLELRRIKNKIGLRLIRFEDAMVELDPYVRVHPFETAKCLIESIADHYKEELKSQAAKILGAVDFLGNPLGLVNDVTDGISGLIHEGNVGGLIKNVAHGLSNTAAKLSESLSDGLGLVAIDEKHQKMRKQIRQGGGGGANAGNDHLMAGIRGLGIGIFGGVTSLITQTYEGAAQEGVQGFFSGFGKGLVGTVAKPAVGFLDLASGAASAVRDTSKRNSHISKTRMRPPRIYVGPGGLLSRYYLQQALGQELLYNLNDQNYSELFIAKEVIRSEGEDVQVLISSERIYCLSSGSSSLSNIMLMVEFEDLYHCSYVCSHVGAVSESRHYLQLFIKDNSSASSPSSDLSLNNYSLLSSDERVCKKPKVRCDSKEVTEKVVMQISYAKSLYEERISMLPSDDDPDNPFGLVL